MTAVKKTSDMAIGLPASDHALVPGVPRASHSPSSSSANVKERSSLMRKNNSRALGNLRDQVRQDLAEMLQQAGRPVAEQQGVMAAIATVSRWLGWSASKARRHWYGEVQTVAAHDYLHAQQVLIEKRKRVESARKRLADAVAEFNALCNEGD